MSYVILSVMLVLLPGISTGKIQAEKRALSWFSSYTFIYERSGSVSDDIDFEKSDSEVGTLLILK